MKGHSCKNELGARALDISVSLILIAISSPVLAVFALYSLASTGRLWRSQGLASGQRRSRFSSPSTALGLALRRSRLDRLAQLFDLLFGASWLVGPRLRARADSASFSEGALGASPRPYGWVSTAYVRERMNVLFGEGAAADRADVENRSLRHSLSVLLKAALALILGQQGGVLRRRIEICHHRIDNNTLAEALAELRNQLTRPDPLPACSVAFLNADSINKATKDPGLRASIAACHRVYADGFGLKIAAALHRTPLRENVNGTDLVPRLLDSLSGSGIRVFLFGARPEVVARYAAKLESKGLSVAGFQHGYLSPAGRVELPQRIRESGAELVLVALGAPYQEAWLTENLAQTGARLGIAVGGLFDFESGRIPRAPQALRELGLEWTYRLWQEPRRMWQRYILGNPMFLARALQSAWNQNLSPHTLEGSLS